MSRSAIADAAMNALAKATDKRIMEFYMSRSDEWSEQQQDAEEAAQSEAELYYSIMDALQTAKNLGLSTDHLTVLCYVAGVQLDDLEN